MTTTRGRWTGHIGRALAVVALLAGGLIGPIVRAGSAMAGTVTATDPIGDVTDAKGDITSVGATFEGASLVLEIKTANMIGAYMAPGWSSYDSFLAWGIDTNLDDTIDLFVYLLPIVHVGYSPNLGGPLAVVVDPLGNEKCRGLSSWPDDAVMGQGTGGYRAWVDASCLGNPAWVRVQAAVNYALNPGDPNGAFQFDLAPEIGWTSRVFSGVPFGSLDSVTVGVGGVVTVAGWATDPDSSDATGVHVYVDGAYAASTTTAAARPDVNAAYPELPGDHGYSATTAALAQGAHTVCAYAINKVSTPGANASLGCRTVVVNHNPFGSFDVASRGASGIVVGGWALDPDTAASIDVHVYVDGVAGYALTAGGTRDDVAGLYPGYGSAHGFSGTVPAPATSGPHTVCAYAINKVSTPGANASLGCRTVVVNHNPFGSFDVASRGASGIVVGGWALDPDTAASIDVHVYVDGVAGYALTAGGTRDDVAGLYPGYGSAHGFSGTVPAPATSGPHTVCAYAINKVSTPGANASLGCRTVVVNHNPFGSFDVASRGASGIVVGGWALDPDTAASIDVHVYVDGVAGYALTAGGTRDDVAGLYPGYGSAHGFSGTVPAPATSGPHTVCAYAINKVSTPGANASLGCRTVVVNHNPFGSFDVASRGASGIVVGGWALDPDTAASIDVHVYVDGVAGYALTAGGTRDDVAGLYPGYGSAHGFSGTVPAPATSGPHTVCAYAINKVSTPGANASLGCRTVQ